MLCDVVRRRRRCRRRWAHAPVIHATSHFDHKKRVAWVPISMHTCGSFFYNYGAPLGGPLGHRSSANIVVLGPVVSLELFVSRAYVCMLLLITHIIFTHVEQTFVGRNA